MKASFGGSCRGSKTTLFPSTCTLRTVPGVRLSSSLACFGITTCPFLETMVFDVLSPRGCKNVILLKFYCCYNSLAYLVFLC